MAGRPEDVTDAEILEVFLRYDDPAFFTGEIADELPIKRDGVRVRLNALEQDGLVGQKKRGNMAIWWLTAEGEAYATGDLDDGEA